MSDKLEILKNLIIIALTSTHKIEYGADTHLKLLDLFEKLTFEEILNSNDYYILKALQIIKETEQLNEIMENELKIIL